MIVGTAGHIDHGKTSLVHKLTGVDTDRLKEEKARGISIDLGFAYWPRPNGEIIGFVDVPGHEGLVHNMLAGAAGIDFVMLVIAADDGVMPQTREHLAIMDLLGLQHGIVALNKCDLVGADRLAAATSEIRAVLAGTGLQDAEILPVSAVTGEGLDVLAARLDAALARPATRPKDERFRLAVRAEPLVLATGRLERREGTTNILVDRIERLERPDLPAAKVTHIEPRRAWSSETQEEADLRAVAPTGHSFGRRGR